MNPRTLIDPGYDRTVERLPLPAAPIAIFERGEFRHGMSKPNLPR